jgi:hypothetical protein
MSELIGRWNYYFLRYAVGTVVGAVIIVFLANPSAGLDSSFKDLKVSATAITLLTALGLAYCYIASAPGTVFHVARGLFYQGRLNRLSKWAALLIPFAMCLAAIWLLQRYPATFLVSMSYGHALTVFLGTIAGVFIFSSQCVLLILVFTNFRFIRDFYWDLTSARSSKANNVKHYRRSYRDLREHGNAFEIILLESVLAATLWAVGKEFYPVILALWVLPAAFCWGIGTLLEFEIPSPK